MNKEIHINFIHINDIYLENKNNTKKKPFEDPEGSSIQKGVEYWDFTIPQWKSILLTETAIISCGGEGGIRTHGTFLYHRFSRPAP